ncbi:MAG: hypothetical protein ACREFP_22100 [Acetobacteraceae bacterium]
MLLPGFEPYAGRGINPTQEIVRVLDGRRIAGARAVGRTRPVRYASVLPPSLAARGSKPKGREATENKVLVCRLGMFTEANKRWCRHTRLAARVAELFAEVRPAVVLLLGLWPGEPTIRIERGALNLADFEIPDNAGSAIKNAPLIAASGTVPRGPHGDWNLGRSNPRDR